jgi:hypothetical protein
LIKTGSYFFVNPIEKLGWKVVLFKLNEPSPSIKPNSQLLVIMIWFSGILKLERFPSFNFLLKSFPPSAFVHSGLDLTNMLETLRSQMLPVTHYFAP